MLFTWSLLHANGCGLWASRHRENAERLWRDQVAWWTFDCLKPREIQLMNHQGMLMWNLAGPIKTWMFCTTTSSSWQCRSLFACILYRTNVLIIKRTYVALRCDFFAQLDNYWTRRPCSAVEVLAAKLCAFLIIEYDVCLTICHQEPNVLLNFNWIYDCTIYISHNLIWSVYVLMGNLTPRNFHGMFRIFERGNDTQYSWNENLLK